MDCQRPQEYNTNVAHRLITVIKKDGSRESFDYRKIEETIQRICSRYPSDVMAAVNHGLVLQELIRNMYEGMSTAELKKALVLSAVAFIELDPAYNHLATGLCLQSMYQEVLHIPFSKAQYEESYREGFAKSIKLGVKVEILDKRMETFDLERLAQALYPERDQLLKYTGLQTLYERYFLKDNEKIIELPQVFWMRVAMGLSLGEENREDRAIEFYQLLSSLRYTSATPTLFHAGTVHPQLSSCYLTFVDDDLNHIFKCYKDNAFLAKWSGGIGNDWTSLRATGSMIKTLKMKSQGVIPFLKIANDVVSAINRSGNRRGATCAYLESWHMDYEDFLDLRRNTGDERRRAHDMNIASWIPDLLMKRVMADKPWTFFSPLDTPDLHEIYGKEFEQAYEAYEEKALAGELKHFYQVPARTLWRKMLSRLFETGHPWLVFKDACNIRSPQDHAGVVHSSNLCTEITLNTSRDETAVCNLGSINMSKHVIDGKLDNEMLADTVKTAVRMLDNVIDLNFYPTAEAKNSNKRHRPVGLGIMGLQDALFQLDVPFDDERALKFSDNLMETITYHGIMASSELAKERGTYESYEGSKWSRNLFPIDTIDLLEQERGVPIEVSRDSSLDWTPVREHVKQHGMRNSNLFAIAPTATISNIAGCFPSIEPIFKNLYVKANISGEFTIINEHLIRDLKKLGLWNKDMLDMIKYYDGSLQMIDGIPANLRKKYKEAFELDQIDLLKRTAVRAKWIDQSQSHNVFLQGVSGTQLSDIYMTAWKLGIKSTYYLRTMGATQIEKSTLDAKKFGFTQKRSYEKIGEGERQANACNIDDESCEACQ